MKLPELPNLNDKKNNSKETSGALNLPDLDNPDLNESQGLPDETNKVSDKLKLPDLIEFDNMLKEDDEDKKFKDIPLGKPGKSESKLEPNQMFADLPLDVEFKEKPNMFGDIPLNKSKVETEVKPNREVEGLKEFGDIKPIKDEATTQAAQGKPKTISNEQLKEETVENKQDSQGEVNTEGVVDSKKPLITKPDGPTKIDNDEVEIEVKSEENDEQLDDMMDAMKEDFNHEEIEQPPKEQLEEVNDDLNVEVDQEDFEEDFGFLPQVDLDDDIFDDEPSVGGEIDYGEGDSTINKSDHDNEFDEEKIKLFFADLKGNILKLKDKIFKGKKGNKIKGRKKTKPKKINEGKRPSKAKKIKGDGSSNKILTIAKYSLVIVLFAMAVFFLFSRLGSFGSSYLPIEELTGQVKLEDSELELSGFSIKEKEMSFNITNNGEKSASFILDTTLKTKSKLKTSKIRCESGIMSVAPGDIITENIYCEEKIEKGFEYKIDIDIQKID